MPDNEINVFANDEIAEAMQSIIAMFDSDALQKEIILKQTAIVKTISSMMANSFGETFMYNFSDEACEDLTEFYSEGIITPTNFPIDAHLKGIAKVLNDNNSKLQDAFKAHIKWEQDVNSKAKQFKVKVDIQEELSLLSKMFPYDISLNAWEFPTFNLQYTDSDREKEYDILFPGIYFKLDFDIDDVTRALTIVVDEETVHVENGYDHNEGYVHPHIGSDRRICYGDASSAAQLFWERKELLNLGLLMSDTLNTYNPRSPYKEIYHWADKKLYDCENCGETVDEDNVSFIGGDSDLPSCGGCRIWIDEKDTYQWHHDYVKSNYNGKFIHRDSATIAYVSKTKKDYIFNILADSNFTACNSCNNFFHVNLINTIDGITECHRCANKRREV